jgi:ABC-type Fe3+-hydroxamate transport system substrate-binding protein
MWLRQSLTWAAVGEKSDPQQTYDVAAWSEIPAVRERRVYVVRDELLNTPGPPLVDGARELLRLFYPELAGVSPKTRARR